MLKIKIFVYCLFCPSKKKKRFELKSTQRDKTETAN